MLRMSKLADYGTVVMTCIAQQPERTLSAADIAIAVRLEPPTVSKLLKQLQQAGLLASQRGARGGYRLARPSTQISVADIISAIEGYPMGLTECSSMPGLCTRELSCAVRGNWQRISQSIREILQQVSLAELATPSQPINFGRMPKPHATPAAITEVPDEQHSEATG